MQSFCSKRFPAPGLLAVLFLVFFHTGPAWCGKAEKIEVPPLFPVALDQEFKKPEKAFKEARDLILKNYYTPALDEQALYRAAIKGMLRHVSPPENPNLARLWAAEEYAHILESLTGEQVTLGIKSSFNPRVGSLTVTEVLPGSPAEMILKPMDRILRIDGKPLAGKTAGQLNKMLEGEEGTEVSLTVNRDIKVFDVTLKRQKIETQDWILTPLNDRVSYLEIKKFSLNLAKELRPALEEMQEKGVKGLILDLRNNSGGVFSEALRVAELFLPEKQVILLTLQRESPLKRYVSANKDPFDFSLGILTNKATASSSEVLASALRDNGRAFIVGTKTFGKGVFETTFTLKNDSRIKFITGAMYSPKGRSWQGRGVVPDFLAEQDEAKLALIRRSPPRDRLVRDVAMITAYKLLLRK